MKTLICFRPAEPQRGETLVLASLGLAGVAGVAFAAVAMLDFVAGSDQIAAALSANPPVVVQNEVDARRGATNAGAHGLRVPDRPRPATDSAPPPHL